jgi:hypothetical protein
MMLWTEREEAQMETRRYISLAFWAKERCEHSRDEITNVVSLTRLLEVAAEQELSAEGQVSPIARSADEAA